MIDSAHTPVDKWGLSFVGDELGADVAHVWRWSPDQPADMTAILAPLLSRDEYQRAERFHNRLEGDGERRSSVDSIYQPHRGSDRRREFCKVIDHCAVKEVYRHPSQSTA